MKMRGLALSVMVVVGMNGMGFYFATTDLSPQIRAADSERFASVLINNDVSALHCGNIAAAEEACRAYPFDEILSFGGGASVPTWMEIDRAFEELQRRNVRVGLLYLTGHGSLYRSAHRSEGESCVMLKDRPLRVGDLVEKLGTGPCVIYTDVCYSPGLLKELKRRLQGDYLLLTDKPVHSEELSCRGVSTHFWTCLRNFKGEKTAEGAFWEASMNAWRKACSRGDWMQIGNRPIARSLDLPMIIDQEESRE